MKEHILDRKSGIVALALLTIAAGALIARQEIPSPTSFQTDMLTFLCVVSGALGLLPFIIAFVRPHTEPTPPPHTEETPLRPEDKRLSYEQARALAIEWGALEPLGLSERLAASLAAYNDPVRWKDTPRAQARLHEWTMAILNGAGPRDLK